MQYLSERLSATRTGRPPAAGDDRRAALFAQQRARILAATERLIAERGCAGATIERIAKAARVSSITFYEHFEGREEAFVATLEQAVTEGRVRLAKAAPAGAPWPKRVREVLRALLEMVVANPDRARMFLVESQRGGPVLLSHYEGALDVAAARLREGRALDPAAATLPQALEETTAAGVAWLLRERLETAGPAGIEELLPRLVDVVLGPYVGTADALHADRSGGGG